MIEDGASPEESLGVGEDSLGPLPPEQVSPNELEDALRSVAKSWISKLEQAAKHKRPFSMDAEECLHFFDGSSDWFWNERSLARYSKVGTPSFKMVINKAYEAVKLFGSVIYSRNPVRNVNPRRYPVVSPAALGIDLESAIKPDPATGMPQPPDPLLQQFIQVSESVGVDEERRETLSKIMESYLNYTPVALNFKEHCRQYVDEAIIKGMSCLWTEMIEVGGEGDRPVAMVGSFYDSVDNLLFDPDADDQEGILWCARKCVHPVKDVAEKYGISEEKLRGNLQSYMSRDASAQRDFAHRKRKGKTNDLITYWKVYSRTGFGADLKGSPKEFRDMFDSLGRNCYIVVAEGVDFPLNVTKEVVSSPPDESGLPAELFTRTRWPIPFHADPTHPWPFTPLQFTRKPGYSWPIAPLKPGLPELRFMNWTLSFLATRLMVSCKTMVGVAKAAGDDLKDQILKHEEGGFSLIELSETLGKSIDEIVNVFQFPEVNQEIFRVVSSVAEMFDKRVGLTELVYGLTRNQFRSAAEAQVKAEQISVRPDDMANVLEDALSLTARKEALASRWLLEPDDVKPVIGPLGAIAWEQSVQRATLDELARSYDYRIEAGSARKPNKAGKIEALQIALQTLGPMLQPLAMQGQPDPWNALVTDYLSAIDLNPAPYLVQPPPPPSPPPGAAPGEPPPGAPPPSPGGGAAGNEPPPQGVT